MPVTESVLLPVLHWLSDLTCFSLAEWPCLFFIGWETLPVFHWLNDLAFFIGWMALPDFHWLNDLACFSLAECPCLFFIGWVTLPVFHWLNDLACFSLAEWPGSFLWLDSSPCRFPMSTPHTKQFILLRIVRDCFKKVKIELKISKHMNEFCKCYIYRRMKIWKRPEFCILCVFMCDQYQTND